MFRNIRSGLFKDCGFIQPFIFLVSVFFVLVYRGFSGWEPISCRNNEMDLPTELLNTRCGRSSLFSVVKTVEKFDANKWAYPGFGDPKGNHLRYYHNYPFLPIL